MVVAVTGACGHVGANLVRALLERGRRVRALVHTDRRALEGLAAEQVAVDILDPNSVRRALAGAEVVYHLAAFISLFNRDRKRMYDINVGGTRNVVLACAENRVRRLVHFSSIHAFSSKPRRELITENRALAGPRGSMAYDWTKAEAEREVQSAVSRGLDAVIVNPTAILGPCDFKLSSLGTFLLALHDGTLRALVRGGFNWVDVRDVVEGALAAEQLGRPGERYLLSGTWCTVKELAKLAEEVTGKKAPAFTAPMWLARAGVPFAVAIARLRGVSPLFTGGSLYALRNHRHISHAKASAELGYAPRPLRETVRDTFSWFGSHGRLQMGATSTPSRQIARR
jgi:dihydroflavonol-4-reductase